MPASLALILWFLLLLALLAFDPAKDKATSPALWIPIAWMFFLASRLPSQWLGESSIGQAAQAMQDGNPLDRGVLSFLILLALVVLISRSFKWSSFIANNSFLAAYLLFALVSVVWSDFPLVACKRWFRDLGDYLVILVIVSDPRPLEALRTVLRRLSYLLLPLSVLVIKYFPQMGTAYDNWTGEKMWVGVTTSKNMLGMACLVCGLFLFWDVLARWSERKERRAKRILILDAAFLVMTFWLLNLSHSATSKVCLALGCLVILATRAKLFKRHPGFLKFLIPVSFLLYLLLAFGFNLMGDMAEQLGRNPTLTDRTKIWSAVLSIKTNPLVGTGYASFWLGSRLPRVWALAGRVNEAHNGYLEVYLNLGLIGVALLIAYLLASYRRICKTMSNDLGLASLSLALWAVILFYDMTEAGFRSSFVWLTFLTVAFITATAKRSAPASAPALSLARLPTPEPNDPRAPMRTPARTLQPRTFRRGS